MSASAESVDSLTRSLLTREMLVGGLRGLGIVDGDIVLVHTRLSALGFVPGAAQTVVEALLDSIGPAGTIVMPTYSGELSDPAEWRHPPVPTEWIDRIRESTPAYDPVLTPTCKMGVVPEYFRTYPGVRRSQHPQSSFAAIGKRADQIVGMHPLDDRFGPNSPLGAIERLGGKSLLLGAPLNTNSILYLALYSDQTKSRLVKSSPIKVCGDKVWKNFSDIAISNSWFQPFTEHALRLRVVRKGKIGDADCYLFPAAETIAEAVAWRKAYSGAG